MLDKTVVWSVCLPHADLDFGGKQSKSGREGAIRTRKLKCNKPLQTFIFQAPRSSLEVDITRRENIANLVHAVTLHESKQIPAVYDTYLAQQRDQAIYLSETL